MCSYTTYINVMYQYRNFNDQCYKLKATVSPAPHMQRVLLFYRSIAVLVYLTNELSLPNINWNLKNRITRTFLIYEKKLNFEIKSI